MRTRDLMCPFCLSERAALRIDRKGRPYLTCTCGTRCFVPTLRDAVRYVAIAESVFRAHVHAIANDPVQAAKFAQYEASVASAFKKMFAASDGASQEVAIGTDHEKEKIA